MGLKSRMSERPHVGPGCVCAERRVLQKGELVESRGFHPGGAGLPGCGVQHREFIRLPADPPVRSHGSLLLALCWFCSAHLVSWSLSFFPWDGLNPRSRPVRGD